MAVTGIRSEAVTHKVRFHLARCKAFFEKRYVQENISSFVKRDVIVWREHLRSEGLAASTIHNHMASLSGFGTWAQAQDATAFVMGDPTKGIGDLPLPPLEPSALDEDPLRTLKNPRDRLFPFYRFRNRRWLQSDREAPLQARARPWRDRAMVFVLRSTGLRREELVRLNLSQLSPTCADELRQARRGQINGVVRKGKTQRDVFLLLDARLALADYFENEHARNVTSDNADETPVFLSAIEATPRRADGRLSPRSVNHILEKIGKWHDAGIKDEARHISPLRPHDLRGTLIRLALESGGHVRDLQEQAGHANAAPTLLYAQASDARARREKIRLPFV